MLREGFYRSIYTLNQFTHIAERVQGHLVVQRRAMNRAGTQIRWWILGADRQCNNGVYHNILMKFANPHQLCISTFTGWHQNCDLYVGKSAGMDVMLSDLTDPIPNPRTQLHIILKLQQTFKFNRIVNSHFVEPLILQSFAVVQFARVTCNDESESKRFSIIADWLGKNSMVSGESGFQFRLACSSMCRFLGLSWKFPAQFQGRQDLCLCFHQLLLEGSCISLSPKSSKAIRTAPAI